jgi:uncharacterized protein YjgD (DUF1641 family)
MIANFIMDRRTNLINKGEKNQVILFDNKFNVKVGDTVNKTQDVTLIDKYRNIDKIKGFGISKIYGEINKGLGNNLITNDIENLNSLINIVPENFQNDFAINYMTTSIFEQYKKLSDVEIKYILNQLIDKYDGGYMKVLNDEYYMEYPLNIIEINSGVKKTRRVIWKK